MAVLTSANVIPHTVEASGAAIAVWFLLRNVSTGDTIDVATLTNPAIQVIKGGVVLGQSDFVEIAATFTGTVVTMPGGLSHSSGHLLVIGCLPAT